MNKNQMLLMLASVVVVALVVTSAFLVVYKEGKEDEKDEGKVKVVASFYPLAFMAGEIGGNRVSVESLIPGNTELHGWQPSVSDILDADDADVLIYSGGGIDEWVEDDLLSSITTSGKEIVKTTEGITLIEMVDPVIEAGHHLFEEGPFENLTAGPNASAAEEVEDSICYNVTLYDDNGTYVGYLTFEPEEEGEFAVYLEHDADEMGFAVMMNDTEVEPEDHDDDHDDHDDDDDDHDHEDPFEWHGVYDLEGNETYEIRFNTTEEDHVKIGIGHLHGHDDHDDHGDDDGGDGHDHGSEDPHTWISPFTAVQEGKAIYDALVKADPAGTAYYTGRWNSLKTRLETLDQNYTTSLSTASIKTIIVSHSAFGYLAHRYGFEQHGVIGLSADEQPSTADIIDLADLMEDEDIYTIFVDPIYPSEYADTLETEVEDRTGEDVKLLSLYLGTGKVDGLNYIEQMEKNLDNLKVGMEVA